MPAPPPGPKIRRVTHDALQPVRPGTRVVVRVLAEPGLKTTVSIGSILKDQPCSPGAQDPSVYVCDTILPADAPAGPHRARATVAGPKGAISMLNAALPVTIDVPYPWSDVNKLNVRIAPVYFAAKSAELDSKGREALKGNVEFLSAGKDLSITVEGHADPDEAQDASDLSRRRAEAVKDHLVSLGVATSRMKVVPVGATQPMVNVKDPTADRALNRVVLIYFEPAKPSAAN
jgi:outer membrane protein OmpA-like peptidoglycan-associated protein